jgi:hypothetical protein
MQASRKRDLRLTRCTFSIAVLTYLLAILLWGCGGGSSSPPPPNPVPSISSLSPFSTTTCATALTLTVNGSNFISASTVQWNGGNRATSYVSATQLTAAITAADLAVAATASVTVVNPAPGGGTSSAASFYIDCTNQISIDAQSPALATISRDAFGVNLTAAMDLTNTNPNYNTMISTLQNANWGMVRWPLAGLSDYYHWQTNSFSSCGAVYGLASRTTFDQFMQQVAQPLGLDVDIVINYGSNATCTAGGDPNEAAAWVDYANNQRHYGIKYWSIGNEQYYGSPILGSTPTTPDFNVSPSAPGSAGSTTYANLIATQFYPLMKARDPSIHIGVDLVVPDNNISSRTMPWDSTVLTNAQFDFVEVHWYGASPANVAVSDSALLSSGDGYFRPALAQLQSELAAAGKANVPIYVGEWGIPGPNGGSSQSVTIVGALYTAFVLGELTKGGIGMAGDWEGFNSFCAPAPPGDYSWQNWFTSSLFEGIAGGANSMCPSATLPPLGTSLPRANAIKVVQQAMNVGDTVFTPAVSSSLATVKAYGARRSSGYGLLLVNLDQNNAVTTAVAIMNDTRTFATSSLFYGKTQYDNSQNSVWTAPVSQSLGQVAGSFSVTLPQWSVTAITLTTTQ